jgi:hypothetical protein
MLLYLFLNVPHVIFSLYLIINLDPTRICSTTSLLVSPHDTSTSRLLADILA